MIEVTCKCGRAVAKYNPIGEDLYSGTFRNTIIEKHEYGKVCICKTCKERYDYFDPHIVRSTGHEIENSRKDISTL